MQYTTNAINIKSYPLGDNDNILLVYSRENGLIKCIAKGSKKIKSKLGARSQVLIANKLLLSKGKNFDKINQAEALNTFTKIRKDFDKLSYSLYLADVISIFCKNEDENSEDIYDIFYKSLENIANSETREKILLNTLKFQISLMQYLGWGLNFKTCLRCGCELGNYSYFSHNERGLFCETCANKTLSKLIKIPNKLLKFLDEIATTAIDKHTRYDDIINLKTVDACFGFMKKYLENLSGKTQKFQDFSKCVSLDI